MLLSLKERRRKNKLRLLQNQQWQKLSSKLYSYSKALAFHVPLLPLLAYATFSGFQKILVTRITHFKVSD